VPEAEVGTSAAAARPSGNDKRRTAPLRSTSLRQHGINLLKAMSFDLSARYMPLLG
jgi:hypothetical protein